MGRLLLLLPLQDKLLLSYCRAEALRHSAPDISMIIAALIGAAMYENFCHRGWRDEVATGCELRAHFFAHGAGRAGEKKMISISISATISGRYRRECRRDDAPRAR